MPILYTDLYSNSSSVGVTMVGANATANTGGIAGLVPAPLVANSAQFLRGDGIWATVAGGSTATDMVGATVSAAGTAGLVPAPLTANIAQFLRGDGEWATAASAMVGANLTANTNGISGLVPAPAAANATQFLRGDGTWSGPSFFADTTGNTVLSFATAYHKRSVSSLYMFNFTDVADGLYQSLTLEVAFTSGSITWPAEVKWPNGTAPVLTAGKTHMFVFHATNATTIFAASITNY